MTAGHLRPVIDLERGNALTTSDLTDWVLAFVNEVVVPKGSVPNRSFTPLQVLLSAS